MIDEKSTAEAIVKVVPESRWIGFSLARAFLKKVGGETDDEAIARELYEANAFTLTKAREIVPKLPEQGFIAFLPERKRRGSAENPITKLFPAAITEQRFILDLDNLRRLRPSLDYEDDRHAGHTLIDFTLTENGLRLPINVKNAGTRFENALQLVGINPDDCVPIPVYKAYDAIEKEPNLLYAIAVDYSLINAINEHLIPLFDKNEEITWKILNEHTGTRIRDAEDMFIYGMTLKHWDGIQDYITDSAFRIISARKSIRVLQKMPKRTPGIGLRAWGTGASAEVNVHICVSEETKPWKEIFDRITANGLEDIIQAVNRKVTEIVYDPEI
ncbi:MAG: hypothetical protein ACYC6O_07550 [Thermoleophilia bacterium]